MDKNSKILGPGWHLSEEGLKIVTENGQIKDSKIILQNALNTDLKEIGAAVLAAELPKSRIEQLVLQVQKVRNVAAPKANEDSQAAPRMLKLTLTDGHSYCQAIEVNPVSAISRDRTPPGSKVLVKNAKISAGYVLLQSNSCTYLGGKVPALYEKWEISKNLLKTARSASILDGPPAWVNFGAKIQSSIPDQPFKSLDNKTKDTEKQNTEFEVQRKDAIAEASTGAVRKVFGGGSKKTNNLQQQQHEISERKPRVNRERNTKERTEQKDLEKTQKPPERVSLFHFLEEKLPANEIPEAKTSFYESRSNNEHSNRKPYQKENSFPAQNHRGNKPNLTNSNKQFENVERPPRFYNNSKNYTPRTANGYVQPKPAAAAVNQNRTTASNSVDAITNNMEKVSLNSQFASRSLRQHLNLSSGSKETQKVESDSKWNVGDACLAKYWEDGKFYNATITAVTDTTCVVHFKDYGNMEEVLKNDCKPVNKRPKSYQHQDQRNQNARFYGGAPEYRRNANKQF